MQHVSGSSNKIHNNAPLWHVCVCMCTCVHGLCECVMKVCDCLHRKDLWGKKNVNILSFIMDKVERYFINRVFLHSCDSFHEWTLHEDKARNVTNTLVLLDPLSLSEIEQMCLRTNSFQNSTRPFLMTCKHYCTTSIFCIIIK